MAGLSGSQAYFGIAKNVNNAKGGTPATTPRWRNPFTGGSAGPERVVERLQETDTTRDPGSAYLVRGGASGSPEFYVRPDSFPAYAAAAFGKNVTSGAGPYIHTIDTTAATLPYVSFFKMLGGTLYERYEDCMVSSLTVRAEAGQPLSASLSFMGLSVTRAAAEWPTPGTLDVEEPWFFHEATVAIGGSTVTNVRSFELTLENNVQQQQTDDITLYDVVPGRRELSGSFDMIFDDTDAFAAYKTHHYGSTSGTTQPNTLQTQSLSFTFTKGTDTVQFFVNKAAYEEFPADPDAGGDPVISSVRFAGVRPSSGAFASVTVNNGIANATEADYPA